MADIGVLGAIRNALRLGVAKGAGITRATLYEAEPQLVGVFVYLNDATWQEQVARIAEGYMYANGLIKNLRAVTGGLLELAEQGRVRLEQTALMACAWGDAATLRREGIQQTEGVWDTVSAKSHWIQRVLQWADGEESGPDPLVTVTFLPDVENPGYDLVRAAVTRTRLGWDALVHNLSREVTEYTERTQEHIGQAVAL